ncbi:hypothetical protein L486_05404 [Kwoniella mangroviensis CBS 10435]|uniref:Uncharacterized protein n=1 Tax=Kwoniella mangroviensis CBS 10435 TaxID=1331196 RepID=A0A1B9IMH3_9TREE|nr:hypothetical protein L486_05404 [Kwoniella mangroviensis CBS 10435]
MSSAQSDNKTSTTGSKPYNPSAALNKILADSTAEYAPLDTANHGSDLNPTNSGTDYQFSPGSQSATAESLQGSKDTSQPTTRSDRANATTFGPY